MDSCPERANTVAFASGQLTSEAATRAQSHAAGCEECRGIVHKAASAPTIAVGANTMVERPDGAALTLTEGSGRPTLSPVRTMIGRYRVLTRLGAGGMGVVYAAEDPDLDRKVAIKVLHATSEHSARLVREARALARLRHPHVITIYEVGREVQEIFVVMELVEGATLREWLRRDRPLADKLDALLAAGRGLAAAHAEGLIHRDFKPENVMVGSDGRVQVLDFGLAKDAGTDDDATGDALADGALDQLTLTGTMLGTPAYMAPEQFAATATDARTDQFAFCVTLFEALHGHRPFAGATVGELKAAVTAGRLVERTLDPDVPAHVQAAITRGLSVDPAARFPSMPALLDALGARPERRRRWLVPAVAAAAVVGLGTAWVATRDRDLDAAPPPPTDPVLAVLERSNLPAVQAEPLPGDPYKLTVHRLSNGLTVWISPNRKTPRIAAAFVIRAGSRDEPGTTGVAHMVEHLMFAGTTRIGTTDHAAELPHLEKLRQLYAERARAPEAARAKLLAQIDAETAAASRFRVPSELWNTATALGVRNFNGQSDRDSTTYSADLPSNKFGQWAKLEGERWSSPVFRSFHAETGIVFDEMHQTATRRGDVPMYDTLFAELFPNHPYGHPVGGTYADVVAEPFLESEDFHRTWYAPNNAALVLAGDIDPAQAIPTLERELSRWQPHDIPRRDPRPVPMPAAAITRDVRGIDATLALVGWRGPAIGDPDALVIDVIAELARHLGEAYEDRAKLWVAPQYNVEAGAIVFLTLPAPGKRQDDGIAVAEEIARAIRDGKFPQATLDAVLENYRFDLGLARDGNDQRVFRMANAYMAGHTWRDELAEDARVTKLTKADIQRVAARYLTDRRVAIRSDNRPYTLPEVKPPEITPLEPAKDTQSAFVKKLLSEETVEIPPRFVSRGRDYDLRDTPSGPLIAVPNTDSTDYQLRLQWQIGSRREPLVCAALRALQSAGGAEERARRYARVERINFTCDEDTAEVTVDGRDPQLADGWRDALALLAGDVLTEDTWRAAAASYVQERQFDNTSNISSALALYTEFGAASPRLTALPATAIARAGVRDARAALHVLLDTRHTTSYFGPRTLAELQPPAGAPPRRAPPAQVATRRVPGKPARIVLVDSGANAALELTIQVSLGRLDRAHLAQLRLYADYLTSNGGGLLFEALRTNRGSTYFVMSTPQTRSPDDATLWIRAGAPPAQLPDTLALVLATLRERRVEPQHFARARRSIEQSYRAEWLAPRSLASTIEAWLWFGYDRDPRQQSFDEILRAVPHDLEGLTARVAAAPIYVSVSGDLHAIDRAKLAKLGTVEVVERGALFVP